MECSKALPLMHEYLDGDLEGPEAIELKKHLISCPSCNSLYKELEQADAMVRMLPRPHTPEGMTARIMAQIPQPKKRSSWLNWVKAHPAVSVASVFILVMVSSFLSLWNEDKEMVVKGANLDQVVIRGDTVVIPEGHTLQGDLMVKRGKVQVEGAVQGNLVVIDGTYNLAASTAYISGQVTQVDETLEWVWYKVNEFFSLFSK